MIFETSDLFEPGRWTTGQRQALRDRVDSLISRVAAAGYPCDGLRAEVAEADEAGDLAHLHGVAWDLSLYLSELGLDTVEDRRWRAGLDDE